MHPKISHFPRNIFYQGALLDGPNVRDPTYGNPLLATVQRAIPSFSPFMIFDLDSKETRSGGPSLSNVSEAQLAVHLVEQLKLITAGSSPTGRIAVISPYAEQCKLLHRSFARALGPRYESDVEVNTVDAFQGREANIVIFSAVRAAGSHGIGFLADVRRMNVAMTRAKFFLFMIARCQSVVVNPYWSDLVKHARETRAVLKVPMVGSGAHSSFGDPRSWILDIAPGHEPRAQQAADHAQNSTRPNDVAIRAKPSDPRKKADRPKQAEGQLDSSIPKDPRRLENHRNKRGYANVSMNQSNSDVVSTEGLKNVPSDPRKRRNKTS
jgi:AAA domain